VLPTEKYVQRLAKREARIAQFEKLHIRLGNARLLIAVLFVVIAWLSFANHAISAWWLAAPVAMFAALAVYHSRVLQTRDLAQRAAEFYKAGLARVEDRWDDIGETGERFLDPHHVYAADLDLFGKGSMFQLLSTARTRMGEETLASWLLDPSPMEAIKERHGALAELRSELDLREDLAVLGEDASIGVHPDALAKWAEASNRLAPAWLRWVSALLAALAVASAGIWIYWRIATPFVIVVMIEAILTYRLKKSLESLLHDAEHAFRDLGLLSRILARFEAQTFTAPRLLQLQGELLSSGTASSRSIARLRALVDRINSRHNIFVRIIDAPLMYSVQVAFAAEQWRHIHGRAVKGWVAAVGEIEALLSLANYSFEHPADPFPEFVEGAASFQTRSLGHPLLSAATCVRNDVEIPGDVRILLISGSNMSGKSTLMRAVGLNIVLAMAGGPVRAEMLRLTPLCVGASIRVTDSLQEGSSHFYAEIKRLRQIFDLAGGDSPLIFLLDELLQGTNSNDRRIGAQGIVRALLERGAIGLVSTHDLALTDIGGSAEGHLRNVHFQDELKDGRMTFDYKLRDGVVTKSNGLELMRSLGLKV
jgi:hypothetical protein